MALVDPSQSKLTTAKPLGYGAGTVTQDGTNGGAGSNAPNTPLPQPSATSAMPNEGIYLESQAQANKAYADAMAGLQSQRNGIYQTYGFQADGSVDPNNTLGLYQSNLRSSAQEQQAASENALGRNLGGTGLGAQIAEAPIYGEQQSLAQLLAQYQSGLSGNSNQQVAAASTRDQSLLDARNQQISDAILNNMFTPAGGDNAPDDSSPDTKKNTDAKTPTVTSSPAGQKLIQQLVKNTTAVKVSANKTGASANKKQGVFAIH